MPVKYDKRRNRIEIMFGRLKDWRRVATRYDRCPTVFFSALTLAATVFFWLRSTSPEPKSIRSSYSKTPYGVEALHIHIRPANPRSLKVN